MSFTSLHWGVYRPQVEEGKLKALLPAEWDKDPSPIGDSVADAITSPTRVMRPAIRRSFLQQAGGRPDLRGQESFVEVSWEVALDLVASELQRVKGEYGNQAILAAATAGAARGVFITHKASCIASSTASAVMYSVPTATAWGPGGC